MTQWMVDSEHSMENVLEYTTRLAGTTEPGKSVTIIFASEFLMEVFLVNLAVSFSENGINPQTQKDMEMNCIVPPRIDSDDESNEGEEYDIGF